MIEVIIRSGLIPFLQLVARNNINISGAVLLGNVYRFVFDDADTSRILSILRSLSIPARVTRVRAVSIEAQPGQLLNALLRRQVNPSYTYLGEDNILITRFQ